MSRNSSGTYSKAVPSFVPGTVIDSGDMNAQLDDVGTELTDSLSRSGKGGMLARMRGVDGTSPLPAYSFTSETTLGLYRAASGDLRASSNGTDIQKWSSTGVTFYQAGLYEKGLTVTQSTVNGSGTTSTGNGSGAGLRGTGGATGAGVTGTGGSTSGVGGNFVATGGGSAGLTSTGHGLGPGGIFTGGPTGVGLVAAGGATSGAGLVTTATDGNGLSATGGGASSVGVSGTGPFAGGLFTSSAGEGARATGAAGKVGLLGTGGSNAPGVQGAGTGTGAGGTFEGGATGIGVLGAGGSGSVGGSFAGGVGASGVVSSGNGAGAGVEATGGATGPGGTFAAGTSATGGTPAYAVELTNGYLRFVGVTAPNSTTAISNAITPGNIINASATITLGATPSVVRGSNVSGVANSTNDVVITFAAAFASADYTCVPAIQYTPGDLIMPYVKARTTTTVTIGAVSQASAVTNPTFTLSGLTGSLHVICTGAQ